MLKARTWRSLATTVGVFSAIGLTAGAAPALAQTAIGQDGPPAPFLYWAAGSEIIETATPVPAGGGVITAFHTESGSCPLSSGVYDFQVLRPADNNYTYRVIGHTGNLTDPCDAQPHSYPVSIAVQPGDVIGAYTVSNWQGAFADPYVYMANDLVSQEPAVGQTINVGSPHRFEYPVDESATVVDSLSYLKAAVTGVGPGRSLANKISSVQAYLAAGDRADACGALTAFTNEVKAQSGKSVPKPTATTLLTIAQGLAAVNGCSASTH